MADNVRAVTTQPRNRLDPSAWTMAAFALLAEQGIDGVRVELLARKLNVTKGSFYWHFKDRDELHATMLKQWRRNASLDMVEWFSTEMPPTERFGLVMRIPCLSNRADQTLEIELAIRLWASRDQRARDALREIDALRIRYISALLVACGIPEHLARGRAILAYGYKRMTDDMPDEITTLQCEQLLIS